MIWRERLAALQLHTENKNTDIFNLKFYHFAIHTDPDNVTPRVVGQHEVKIFVAMSI